ncbi:hypothetical protein AKJ38_01995 [candidate division MSBL1 archaeon SCGC-AAA259I14]|uniref:Tyr recombinase domain-containing protein n=2 Tax=candidate division MSBL1 TaxID=215777 RepID=A0A133USH6_9EURY|nr:hypothetical protein AKJ36_03500 [candidate division MSBL1 archaeon SCGC-AAA259I07]KXA97097.1 hypothetical protein AKJ38_01995 [candidate division MSBL1 archaeon SCGC-AAA259I14]
MSSRLNKIKKTEIDRGVLSQDTIKNSQGARSPADKTQACGASYTSKIKEVPEKSLDSKKDILKRFEDLLSIDKDLDEKTVRKHCGNISEFLDSINKPLIKIGKQDLRDWLRKYKENYAKATYANKVKTIRVFVRDFLGSDIAENFSIPQPKKNNQSVLSDQNLRKFYQDIQSDKYRAIFLFYASSGLRTSEVLNLTMEDVDFEKRMLIPKNRSRTKKSYVSFYNSESEEALDKFLPQRKPDDDKIFQVSRNVVAKTFRRISKRSGVKITPKMLRKWFCEKMRRLNVDRGYIDAFCGRVPKTVLDSHYSDFSPERLKEVYEKANIKVLDGE